MKKVKTVLEFVPNNAYNHLLGENHTQKHKMVAGLFIMSIGVGLVKLLGMCETHFLHFIADLFGYGIHGIGLIPFVEFLIHKNK